MLSIIVAMVLGLGGQRGVGAAGQEAGSAVTIDQDDIGGVVTGLGGPEAGVWVIAETDDFETRFARIVATDDEGRYVIPDLPEASYQVWVRGYGLVDSDRVTATPGSRLDLRAAAAPRSDCRGPVLPRRLVDIADGSPTRGCVSDRGHPDPS